MARKINHKQKKHRLAKPAKRTRSAKPPVHHNSSAGTSRKTLREMRTAAAAKGPDTVDALVAASAQALSLRIDPAWRASVTRNLQVILKHAALVDQFSLPDDIEPAPVFRA